MRFIDNNDETITDTLTGLMWTKDAFAFKTKTWEGAMSGKGSCNIGGHKDWRLPSVAELFSLIDYGQHRPALPKDHLFKNVQKSEAYWTSTYCVYGTEPGLEPHAWYVYFHKGTVSYTNKVHEFAVWYVRGN
ncbi:MAG: DUF1566 domain-containing protein [Candidatus Hodarchaeota archaeon]